MKKFLSIITSIIIGIILFFICYNYNTMDHPKEYFNVYLDGEFLGTIDSKVNLESYIDNKTEHLINIKNVTKTYCENEKTLESILNEENVKKIVDSSSEIKYYENNGKNCADIILKTGEEVEKVYSPQGLNIEKVITYKPKLVSVDEIYNRIIDLKSFTIKGYQFTITKEEKTSIIYVTEKEIFEEAVKSLITTYVGKSNYSAYLNNSQAVIESTGSLIENVYIEEEIAVIETQISMDNMIYTEANDLTQYLLYGDNLETKTYKVKANEMIPDIALKNEISSQEFLISNPKYKDENSLIAVGSEVIIRQTNPQLNVVIEKYVVEDKVNDYKVIYQYDETQYIGYEKKIQSGVDGLERVSQRQKIVNGVLTYVEPKGKETLKTSIDEIIIKGDKFIPNVGDLNNWAWPSESGWTMNSLSGYEWRIHPITGKRQFHYGLDISGTGYNSAIYAANNGTVITKKKVWDFGNYIVIDHNNGYYTLYAHMNKFYEGIEVGDTVLRGQQIGYVGSTGTSTGPHIHFELWKGCQFCRINPKSVYKDILR